MLTPGNRLFYFLPFSQANPFLRASGGLYWNWQDEAQVQRHRNYAALSSSRKTSGLFSAIFKSNFAAPLG